MQIFQDMLNYAFGFSTHGAFELSVWQTCARALLVYGLLIGYVRFGKKRFLGQATALDFILAILIGSLTSRAISGTTPFIATMLAAASLIAAHWLLSYCTSSSKPLSQLLKGTDTLLIKRGIVDPAALRRSHMSNDDLSEDLRQAGIRNLDEVEESRLERSGKLSVIKRDKLSSSREK